MAVREVGGTPGGNRIPEWYLRKMGLRDQQKESAPDGLPDALSRFVDTL